MAKIREDFDGTVEVRVETKRFTLAAGDEIPEGARVGGHLTDTGEDVGPEPAASLPAVPSGPAMEPLSADDVARADELDVDGSPDYVRGVIFGVALGATLREVPEDGEPAAEGEFNPADVNAPEVHEYLKAHPEATARVIELERAGRNRKGIVDAYAG